MDGTDHPGESQAGGLVSRVKLTEAEAARIAAYLSRVVPRSPAEQAEILAIVKRLVPR